MVKKKPTKKPEKKQEKVIKDDLPYVKLVQTSYPGIFINERTGVLFALEINPYSCQRFLNQLNKPEQTFFHG